MSSCSNAQSTEVGNLSHQNTHLVTANLVECGQSPLEPQEDEDEDEDVDFNPSLKEIPSPEASSILSSEIEGVDADVVDSKEMTFASMSINSSKLTGEVQGYAVGNSGHDKEEIVMQSTVSPGRMSEKELEKNASEKLKKRKSVLSFQPLNGTVQEKDRGSSSGTDVFNDIATGELSNTAHSRIPIMDFDEEDAICMRTRARYSLASFTLDELETFLQETDDDDDLQNVDDEEEYRKFLAAVLQGGDGDSQSNQENENVDDEDEDNDADFEIEIEEALESDLDESTRDKTQRDECDGGGRRPETRQNRLQKASDKNKKKPLQQAKRPLRPLLPIMTNSPIAPFPALDGRNLMSETASHCPSSTAAAGFVNGFAPHQIGQLYCLIHEHVQLLIQVFSLCVLEPSRQHIASQVQGLISEMLHKHDQVVAWRSVPYPGFCFRPPYIHPSVQNELPNFCPAQSIFESSPTPDSQRNCLSSKMTTSYNSASKGRYEYVSKGQAGSFQTNDGFSWVPSISGPVLSILDVAPLNFVGRYLNDVKIAVREYRRRHVEASCDTRFEREPLFPLPSFSSFADTGGEVLRGTIPQSTDVVPSSSPNNQAPKKTLAAALVESSKKQSVALVPKEIVKLAHVFFPLFNSALFPHKPPPVAVANRVLFTEAEDELLALGLMEFNTDWKAIQQRFLPCKSKHQIFVRQKNRCSSKAPENPIKVVRRMKTSPLTADEQARIQEGLRVYKLDWMSIWKFIVPHRDPSLLPRQWRVALGTQKSYKIDAAKKEKRRLYELKRRKCKAADLANWQNVSEKEDCQTENAGGEISGDESIDNEDEAYVHEAFLADWRPSASSFGSSENHCSNLGEKNLRSDILSQDGSRVWEQPNNYGSGESQPQNNNTGFPAALRDSQYALSHSADVRHGASYTTELDHTVPDFTLKSYKSPFSLRPHRVRRTNNAHLVKLAPDLPPVNLPPSVRVISQSAFKSYQCGASAKVSGAGIENAVPKFPHVAKLGTDYSMKAGPNISNSLKHNITNSRREESTVVKDKCVTEERGNESDLEMHPLLFQAPEDGRMPYYPLSCSTSTSSCFSFFSGNQPRVNLSLFRNPHRANPSVDCSYKSLKSKETTSTLRGIDFHPLLQRIDDVNNDSVTAQVSAELESFRGKFAQVQSSFHAIQAESWVDSGPSATGTKSSSLIEKANELDLEIHLSSTSRKEKAMGSRDETEHNPMSSTISALDSRTTMDTQNTDNIYHRHAELCPTVNSKLVSDAPPLVIPTNNINRNSMDNSGDQSLPEIVMEQEELSDSDEEMGERVEFECEEMADSEGEEGSGCEQITDVQNKEAPNFVMEKVSTDTNCDDQQCELRPQGNHGSNVCIPGKGSTLSLKLGLTGQGKDILSSSSWLSLDSCAPDCPPHPKPKCLESTNGEGAGAKNLASCRPNRSCKKTTPSTQKVTVQKHAMDMPQQSSLGSPAVIPSKKPRKRACRAKLNLNTGMSIESSSCVNNDTLS